MGDPAGPVRLRVLVAAPATGKSTWCRDQRASLGEVLSTDRTRAELGVGEHDLTVSTKAFALVELRASEHLAAGRDVTIDATGSRLEDRTRWLALAAARGAVPVAVRLRCSLWTALRRNRGRDRRVPVRVLVRMWWVVRTLTPDRLVAEGFADVQDLRTDEPRSKTPAFAISSLKAGGGSRSAAVEHGPPPRYPD